MTKLEHGFRVYSFITPLSLFAYLHFEQLQIHCHGYTEAGVGTLLGYGCQRHLRGIMLYYYIADLTLVDSILSLI